MIHIYVIYIHTPTNKQGQNNPKQKKTQQTNKTQNKQQNAAQNNKLNQQANIINKQTTQHDT